MIQKFKNKRQEIKHLDSSNFLARQSATRLQLWVLNTLLV